MKAIFIPTGQGVTIQLLNDGSDKAVEFDVPLEGYKEFRSAMEMAYEQAKLLRPHGCTVPSDFEGRCPFCNVDCHPTKQ